MSVSKGKGPIVDPGICRCCGATKKCRLLNVEYEWNGQKEIYTDMFVDTFGLLLSHLDGDKEDRLICATCVLRLRDAGAFRQQVLQCEERLLRATVQGTDMEIDKEIKQESELKEENNAVGVPIAHTSDTDEKYEDIQDYDDGVCSSNDADDTLAVKAEPLVVRKKALKKEKKSPKRAKKKAKSKVVMNRAKKELLQSMETVAEQLESLQQFEQSTEKPERPSKKELDNEHKAYQNTITIVENSFVCPFDTSFSDYFCVYCRQVYTDPNKLREHTLTHDPAAFKESVNKKLLQVDITRMDCRICLQVIHDLNQLKEHLSSIHSKVFYAVENDFLRFRLTANNLTCIECGSSFSFFHALKKHMAEHFGTCICDVCGAHYFEERMLVLHQKTHQRTDENYPCKDCGKTFKSKHSRNLHESRLHKKEPAYQCPKCDEVLFSYTLRYRHMIEVHGEERTFKCDHCDRAYDSRKSLREHNRRFHLKIFKHQCDLCDKRFYLPSRLKEHMATHTGERNFRCEYCGKSYPRLRGLKVHMQSHNSEKKYRCALCNASFTQNINLRNHVKRQHQSLDMDDGYRE